MFANAEPSKAQEFAKQGTSGSGSEEDNIESSFQRQLDLQILPSSPYKWDIGTSTLCQKYEIYSWGKWKRTCQLVVIPVLKKKEKRRLRESLSKCWHL